MKKRCVENGTVYFKCTHSNEFYTVEIDITQTDYRTHFNQTCSLDPGFYQSCGHEETEPSSGGAGLCGLFVCQVRDMPVNGNGAGIGDGDVVSVESETKSYDGSHALSCNNISNCDNTDFDETNCEQEDAEHYIANCTVTRGGISMTKLLTHYEICDRTKDCSDGLDERGCGYVTCPITNPNTNRTEDATLDQTHICNNITQCDDGSDEADCDDYIPVETCKRSTENWSLYRTVTVVIGLNDLNRCIPPGFYKDELICDDFKDQLNCSNLVNPLTCDVSSYPTTVSKDSVCSIEEYGGSICDDGIDTECVYLTGGCYLHKHQLCDNTLDCDNGADESVTLCKMTEKTTCKRRYSSSAAHLPIPNYWIRDGVQDCEGDEDEEAEGWKQCGSTGDWAATLTEGDCTSYYYCSNDTREMVPFSYLCDRVHTCGNELEVCERARNLAELWTQPLSTEPTSLLATTRMSYCLPGLEDLGRLSEECVEQPFPHPHQPFGVEYPRVIHPNSTVDCRFLYGTPYVFASCSGLCTDTTTSCPLGEVSYDACLSDLEGQRTYTIATKSTGPYLTFAVKENNTYTSPQVFACPSGSCISYSRVCDLADDCGDGSDEAGCANHFQCANSSEYIPVSSYCDGKLDCADSSDECNAECSESIIESRVLQGVAWVLGVAATLLNSVAVVATAVSIARETSIVKFANLVFVFLIAVGDLCVGVYLFAISVIDFQYKAADDANSYCTTKYTWLTSSTCAGLGVLSTFGSQLSLYSMTLLSLVRVYCVCYKSVRGSLAWSHRAALVGLSACAVTLAFTISYLPLIVSFEDFYVNGLVYTDNPMFIGVQDKEKHLAVLQEHYGDFPKATSLSWQVIRRLVSAMFSSYDGPVTGRVVHFYGNSGVCLFKYFVLPDDPQRSLTWLVVVKNAVCFGVITFSYFAIHMTVRRSTERVSTDASSKNTALNTKIALMICTDFVCWIPFTILCVLHYTEVVNASGWYTVFSIVLLPLNSAINPLLYDNSGMLACLQRGKQRVRRLTVTVIESRAEGTLSDEARTVESKGL